MPIVLPPPLRIDRKQVHIEQCSIEQLVQKYGTPLYAYSENRIRENFHRLKNAFQTHYTPFEILYAVKANNNPAIVRILVEEGAGIDACNPAEIGLARQLRVPKSKRLYTGNYCTDEELHDGIKHCSRINLDDPVLLPRLLQFGKPRLLSFRINPGIGKSTIKTNIFAGPDAKFGIPIEHAVEAYVMAQKAGIRRFGIHMMTGSNVLDDGGYFEHITARLLDTAGKIAQKCKITFDFVDIGGGFGIPYHPSELPIDIESIGRRVAGVFKAKCKQHGLGRPTLMVEPGRYFVGDAGVLIGTVQMVKKSYQTFVGTDVTINHLVRPKMYGAYHHIVVANKWNRRNTTEVNVCGSVCDSGDILAKKRPLPGIERGDLLIFCNAGAYGFSMSSQYNARPRAQEILVNGKQSAVIRDAETAKDLFHHCKKAPWS